MAEERRTIEVPASTAWPMAAALGVTLLLAGLVTHPAVSFVGAVVFVSGATGWFRAVLPREDEEEVTVAAAPPIVTRRTLRLAPGEAGHRARYPEEVHPYGAGLRGGVAGGVVMAALACLYGLLAEGSVWYPINLLAASASQPLASASAAQLAAFSAEGLVLGIVIHGAMSLLVGLLYAVLLPMFPWHPLFFGGVAAPIVWTGLAWASMRVLDPALAARVDWPWFVASQIGFGLAAGFVVARSRKIRTLQHASFRERAGIETGRGQG